MPTATRTIGSDTDNVLTVSGAVYRCAVVAARALRTKLSACYDRTIALPRTVYELSFNRTIADYRVTFSLCLYRLNAVIVCATTCDRRHRIIGFSSKVEGRGRFTAIPQAAPL